MTGHWAVLLSLAAFALWVATREPVLWGDVVLLVAGWVIVAMFSLWCSVVLWMHVFARKPRGTVVTGKDVHDASRQRIRDLHR